MIKKLRYKRIIIVLLAIATAFSCANGRVRNYRVQVVNEYDHDDTAYTQGLFFHNGGFYETTGQYGQSSIRKVCLETGIPEKKIDINRKYFVEGSVVFGDELYVLTWTSHIAFIYDIKTMQYKTSLYYPHEGWGLTTDGKQLIASDGSSTLYFLDEKLKTTRRVNVTLDGRPMRYLNELEYIDGKVWANVYMTDLIVIINPKDGKIEATIDCSGLLPRKYYTPDTDVLNGIAKNPENGRLYLTGKNWPKLYEVKLVEQK